MVKIFLEIPDAPAGYGKFIYKHFKLFNDGQAVHLIEPGKTDIFQPRESGKDFIIQKGTLKLSPELLRYYEVNIKG